MKKIISILLSMALAFAAFSAVGVVSAEGELTQVFSSTLASSDASNWSGDTGSMGDTGFNTNYVGWDVSKTITSNDALSLGSHYGIEFTVNTGANADASYDNCYNSVKYGDLELRVVQCQKQVVIYKAGAQIGSTYESAAVEWTDIIYKLEFDNGTVKAYKNGVEIISTNAADDITSSAITVKNSEHYRWSSIKNLVIKAEEQSQGGDPDPGEDPNPEPRTITLVAVPGEERLQLPDGITSLNVGDIIKAGNLQMTVDGQTGWLSYVGSQQYWSDDSSIGGDRSTWSYTYDGNDFSIYAWTIWVDATVNVWREIFTYTATQEPDPGEDPGEDPIVEPEIQEITLVEVPNRTEGDYYKLPSGVIPKIGDKICFPSSQLNITAEGHTGPVINVGTGWENYGQPWNGQTYKYTLQSGLNKIKALTVYDTQTQTGVNLGSPVALFTYDFENPDIPLLGDVNGDGYVNIADLIRLKKYAAFDTTAINSEYSDMNSDRVIDSGDIAGLRKKLLDVIVDVFSPVGQLAATTLDAKTMANPPAGYYSTDVWEAVPMTSTEGTGGEGCQWPLSLETDSVTGQVAFLGTDVGGIYRSLDGGNTWTPATIGLLSCGGTGISIDPNNSNRVLVVGVNSSANSRNGLYLSEDCGESWTAVKNANIYGFRDYRIQIAWDKSSADKDINGSSVVYWSRENSTDGGATNDPGIFKSVDGGYTWEKIEGTTSYGGSQIAVNAKNGWLYVANSSGLYCSKNGGNSFNTVVSGNITSIVANETAPEYVYYTTSNGLYVSSNYGDSFELVNSSSYPTYYPRGLSVSPVNRQKMVIQDGYSNVYYTSDGGKNWGYSLRDYSQSWIPYNARTSVFAWSATDQNRVLSLGGDFVMQSTDGGANFVWSNTGYTGMMTGGKVTFNVNHPQWLYNPSQDYNGGYTLDGGKTWNYIQWYQYWDGYTYGGYVIDENTVVCGSDEHDGKGLQLCVTFNGGASIVKTGKYISGKQVAMGVPGDDNIVFMGEYRSTNKGQSWAKMTNCDGVFTYDPATGTLFGSNGKSIVKSTNNGQSWTTVKDLNLGDIRDIAFEAGKNTLLVASFGNNIVRVNVSNGNYSWPFWNLPTDPVDNWNNIESVCVDQNNSNIIYVVQRKGTYQSQASVMRSVDGGNTWKILNRQLNDGRVGPDGAKEANCVRICTATNEVFVSTCCRGLWKMPVPDIS